MDQARVWHVTAAQSETAQRRAAAFLRERGLGPGDRIALSVSTAPDVLAVVIGALRIGVVPVVLNPRLLPDERNRLLDDADPALVIDDVADLAAVVAGDDEIELAPHPLARPMHYTSGTTGNPKGVWSGVLSEADANALFDDERDLWEFTDADTLLVCSPLHHSAPIRFSTGVLLSGGDVVLVEHFDVSAIGEAIETYAPTASFMVPSHLQRLFAAPALPDLSSFRLLAHAGEACRPSLKQQAFDAFPDGSVWEFYGSTEGQFTVCSPEDWRAHPGSVGRARPQRRLRIDEEGQIWCAVPSWARFEYWRDAAKTAATWDGDAFSVGDLGRLDDDGFLYIDGRRDDLIISGGVNVYPAEIEHALEGLEGVTELAAFGVTDERWGQRVCLAVIGNAPDRVLHDAARATLAAYKRPKDIYRVESLPRTGTGKIRRSSIAAVLGLE